MTVSVQIGLNWFLLSLQTAKPSDKKIYCRYHHQDFWTEYFFFLWYDDVYRAEGHTAVDISVKQSWKKLYLKILMRVTCLGFSNIEEFYQSCNFGGFWWIFENIKPTCCTYQNLCMTFTNILCFLLNFSTSWKSCVKEQWPKKSLFWNFWLNVMICDSRPKRGWNIFRSLKSWSMNESTKVTLIWICFWKLWPTCFFGTKVRGVQFFFYFIFLFFYGRRFF